MKFAKQRILLVGVHLVDRKKERFAGTRQQSRQFAIGAGNFGACIDNHNDRRRFFERDLGLAKNFRRHEVFVIWNYAARIHYAKFMTKPFHFAIEAIARNARLIADDGAA